MSFTPTIGFGDLLTLLGMIAAFFWFVVKMTGDIRLIIAEVNALKIVVAKFGDAIITLARQDERLTASDVRSNTLRQNMDTINDRLTRLEGSVRQFHARYPNTSEHN